MPALLNAVAEQDIGLRVQTNNSAGFKRILYMCMSRREAPRCYIYAVPGTKASFCLLRQPLSNEDGATLELDNVNLDPPLEDPSA